MAQKFIVLQWNDGAQEITALAPEDTDLLRYYTISRVEEYGRIALNGGDKYPNVLIIDRKPGEMSGVMIVEDTNSTQYTFKPGGILSEAGRIDKRFEFSSTEGSLTSFIDSLKKVLEAEGKDARSILQMNKPQKEIELENIRKSMKLRAFQEEQDVLNFIEILLNKLLEP